MADARALLKAKRQEARVTHPYASYTASGQLRCIACGMPIKQASLWEGHIGSKAHRTAVMKMKAREETQALKAQAKRKESEEMDDEDEQEEERGAKRAKVDGVRADEQESSAASSKPTKAPKGFPAGFFSDPSKAPVLDEDGEDEEITANTLPTTQPTAQPKSQMDLEWEQFQKTVVNAPAVDEEAEDDRQVAFARATVFAEPELVKNEREGLPVDEAEETVEKPPPEETEEEKRKRIEREERELIMDRLIEEERAQEEADSRVGLLKMKVEQLKKAREMRRNQAKSKS